MPCAARPSHSHSMLGASAHSVEASAKPPEARISTRRRPKRSASAPCHITITAKVSMYTVRVCCTSTWVAPSAAPIAGKAGR